MKTNCTAAQLHQDVVQVIQQLMMIGKLLQNSSHANRKNKKKGYRGRKRYIYELLVLDVFPNNHIP